MPSEKRSEDEYLRQALITQTFGTGLGVIRDAFFTHNSTTLIGAVHDLKALRTRIAEENLDWARDGAVVQKIYGKIELQSERATGDPS
jgi:hypothetical protein